MRGGLAAASILENARQVTALRAIERDRCIAAASGSRFFAFSTKRFFDNRELRRNPAFDTEDWYRTDTVGLIGGWLSHEHWNERFVKADICPDWGRGE